MKALGFLVRIAIATALVWCVLVECAERFASRYFGMELDGDWFLLVAASSSAEMSGFLSLYADRICIVFGVFVCLVVVLAVLSFRLRNPAFFAFCLIFGCYAAHGLISQGRAWKPLYVAYDTVRSTAEYRELIAAGVWTEARAAMVKSAPAGATNIVFVIGESLTSDRMSVYGYGKETTPSLKSQSGSLAILGPIKTTQPTTARSLRMMLTRASIADSRRAVETLPVSLRLRGYRTVLISAQDHWERYCGVEQMLFAACERRVYVKDVTGDGDCLDGGLIPLVGREFANGDGRPLALFVHMQGSHFPPADRIPPGFAADRGLDDYDRSVCYTDKVLGELIGMLPPRTMLVFTSDHGESVDCAGWRDQRSRSLWRVPLIVFPAKLGKAFSAVSDVSEIWYNGAIQ